MHFKGKITKKAFEEKVLTTFDGQIEVSKVKEDVPPLRVLGAINGQGRG